MNAEGSASLKYLLRVIMYGHNVTSRCTCILLVLIIHSVICATLPLVLFKCMSCRWKCFLSCGTFLYFSILSSKQIFKMNRNAPFQDIPSSQANTDRAVRTKERLLGLLGLFFETSGSQIWHINTIESSSNACCIEDALMKSNQLNDFAPRRDIRAALAT